MIERRRLGELVERERSSYAALHPRSLAAYRNAAADLLGGVPMTWMNKWAGGFPLFFDSARGAHVVDVDEISYVDFCLGDTGAMAGHSPAPTVTALRRRFEELGGATTMLPTEDAAWVGAELSRRFGKRRWSFTLSATDANRWAIRLARHLTKRPKVLVFSHCYHGSVDEAFVVATPGGPRPLEGNVGAPVDPAVTTRVVEFNDLVALERELSFEDVAVVVAEPALTNIGIVLPDGGFHDELRELTRARGSLLLIDETHTISAGPGGCTKAWDLEPDIVTVGKAIGGGIPAGAYGIASDLAARVLGDEDADLIDTGGVGGTLAGNALSVAAMRATLEHVLTDEAFDRMVALGDRFTADVQATIDDCGAPWVIASLAARAEYRFCATQPRNGGQSHAAGDTLLDEYLHLYTANRGVLMTPFHNMALMCPATTSADVDRHSEVFAEAVAKLVG